MKIAPRQIQSFVQSPDKGCAVILIFGPNIGMVKEYAQKIAKTFVTDLNDPFNVVTFTAASISEDTARFRDELASMSLMGGHRIILIKDSADSISTYIKEYCEAPSTDCTIIIEAGDLKPSSPLRKLCESQKTAAAIPCYLEEERNIAGKIRDLCQHAGYAIDADAIRLLSESLAGDSALLNSEVQKMLLYKGLAENYDGFDGAPIRRKIGDIHLQDILECNPNMRSYSLDDLISITALGQVQKAHAMTQKMLSEGLPAIAIFRSFLRHFRRLHVTLARHHDGMDMQSAMGKLKPPIFFKYKNEFAQQAQKWSMSALENVIHKIVMDEAESKKGTVQADTLCLHLILNIARMARMQH